MECRFRCFLEAFINARYISHPYLPRHLSMYYTPGILPTRGIYQCTLWYNIITLASLPPEAFINVRFPHILTSLDIHQCTVFSHPYLPRHLSMYGILASLPPEALINVRYPSHPHFWGHLSMFDSPRILIHVAFINV